MSAIKDLVSTYVEMLKTKSETGERTQNENENPVAEEKLKRGGSSKILLNRRPMNHSPQYFRCRNKDCLQSNKLFGTWLEKKWSSRRCFIRAFLARSLAYCQSKLLHLRKRKFNIETQSSLEMLNEIIFQFLVEIERKTGFPCLKCGTKPSKA
uniref:Uncharacterized protein n=1 Tax=Caenorhabditis tropicalis TaxID=1561998 RepID=A0A1I7TE96_9PELO